MSSLHIESNTGLVGGRRDSIDLLVDARLVYEEFVESSEVES